MSVAFTEALNNLLLTLDPGRRPANRARFPQRCSDADLRVGPDEPPLDWFRRHFLKEDRLEKRARVPAILALCRELLPRIKRALRAAKAEMPMNLSVDADHWTLFTYHA